MNSLCIQQHVHTTHMWNTVKEGGSERGREGERDSDRERKTRKTGRRERETAQTLSTNIMCH